MALNAGMQLGPYLILGKIGAGGMGEVYRATDTKLGRDVAIKTLPAAVAGDRERLARFEREAKLLAALNHPHIATVHALDEQNGTLFAAMELVDGQTLEAKLQHGALSVEDALRSALQIAEALEAAHGKGVIHRDLKPANVMLTPDGQVKVLDFGLAKAFSTNVDEASPRNSPALSQAMTQKGLVLGTAGYMSPEQASGQATDQRADNWAFGVVLYEMLTGLPLFSGESVPHILAEVLKTEPDWKRLPRNLHPRIRQLLERCLAKKPRNRLHSIADARIEIEAVLGDPKGVMPRTSAAAAGAPVSKALILAGATAVAIVAAAIGWWMRPAPMPEFSRGPVVRATLPLPAGQNFARVDHSMIALSQDGSRVAYVADGQIFLRDISGNEVSPIRGTAETGFGPATPTFSPNGEWIAYVHISGAAGPYTVKRVPVGGGAPLPIFSASGGVNDFPQGLTWPTQDTILFANSEGIVRISATGGGSEEILAVRAADERLYSPQVVAGATALLFTRAPGAPGTVGGLESAEIILQSIGEDERTVILQGGSASRYVPTGHLVFAQGTALFAVAVDPAAYTVLGAPVPVFEGLRRASSANTDAANYAVSDTGTLIVIPGYPDGVFRRGIETTVEWVDRQGQAEPFPVRPDDYTSVRISRDGTKVALVTGSLLFTGRPPAIWLFDRKTENLSLLTADPAGDDSPLWSSDGRRVFFRSFRGGAHGLYVIDVDTHETTLIAASPDFRYAMPWTISADDSLIGLVDPVTFSHFNIATVRPAEGEITRVLNEDRTVTEPSFSPNDAWLAYTAYPEPGISEVNIRPLSDVSRTRIPVGPGDGQVFSRDGSALFYRQENFLSMVPVSYEPTLRIGAVVRLFESDSYLWNRDGRAWDPEPNGQRFLMIRLPDSDRPDPDSDQPDGEAPRDRIDIVVNWFDELERLVQAP